MSYDVIVIGLGAMGSAAAYQLASRGARVLGIEAFTPAHELGSSGGMTRIIRLAYFEHPAYVPMLRAAWELWPQIEAQAGDEQLLLVTGGLYVGRRGSGVLDGSLRSAREHGLAHELLDADETRRRFPALAPDEDMATLHEPLAGILFAPNCIRAHLKLAERHGAELRFEERVTGWKANGSGLSVTTDKGTYDADRIVVAAGAWLPKLAPELALPLSIERNVVMWFRPEMSAEVFEPDRLPVWIMELDEEHAFYGFPAVAGQGPKISRHHGGTPVDPDRVQRSATDVDERPVREFIRRHMPARRRAAHGRARVHVHEHAGLQLRDRLPSCRRARADRVAVLGPRLQVLQRGRLDRSRPGARRHHRLRHRLPVRGPLRDRAGRQLKSTTVSY